jgi:predicted glycogen debranching enzyme
MQSPGYFLVDIDQKPKVTIMASTETWSTIHALSNRQAQVVEKIRKKNMLKSAGIASSHPSTARLVLAADQFLIKPVMRFNDMVRLQAIGEEVKSIIAGYPWFTDWGRDTMISLEGLTLSTGRWREAYAILHTFAYYVKDGLIPNMFPEGESKGIYNTADATLWYFQAVERYISVTNDEDILEFLLPVLSDIIEHHVNGTLYGIKMDSDGLLIQGKHGFQLTWMDAKFRDWVVTPRRGKAVEINALWYNALKLYEKWKGASTELSEKCYDSFNKKFWFEEGNYLYDVIEGEQGNDSALRPNQLLAISLTHPVLINERWSKVLEIVEKHLLTPVGLKTLAPHHPDYKAIYDGDLYTRDAAYHQGTVWPWLIGPYIDAYLKTTSDFEGAYRKLQGLEQNLNTNVMNTVVEIFDATSPYRRRGCFSQAWSVAELLRCLMKVIPHLKN